MTRTTHYLVRIASLVTAFLFVFSTVFAQESSKLKVYLIAPFNSGSEAVTTVDSFITYFTKAIPIIFAFAAVAAVVQIVVGGIQYAISGMDPGQLSDAKDRWQKALFGLALALGSYLLLSTLDVRLVDLKFGIQDLGGPPAAQQSGPSQAHIECRNNTCVTVEGAGPNNCGACGGPGAGEATQSGTLNTTTMTTFCKSKSGYCRQTASENCTPPDNEVVGVLCNKVLEKCKPGNATYTYCTTHTQ
jgi:hypothetical protein